MKVSASILSCDFSNLKNGEKESYIFKRNYANHQYLVIDVAENIPFNELRNPLISTFS